VYKLFLMWLKRGPRGGAVGSDSVLQSGRSLVRFDGVIRILHNPSARTMALGSTHPLKEMSTKIISLGVKATGA